MTREQRSLRAPRHTRGARHTRIVPWLTALVTAGALALAGCSEDGTSINQQMRQGDEKGYIAGDGRLEELPPEQRETTITLYGITLEDEPWHSDDYAGQVLVINVWGNWCGPCHAEAPDLEEVASQMREAGEPVQFIGVNVRDAVPTAQAFEEMYGISYPSLQDDGGKTLALLQGHAQIGRAHV